MAATFAVTKRGPGDKRTGPSFATGHAVREEDTAERSHCGTVESWSYGRITTRFPEVIFRNTSNIA